MELNNIYEHISAEMLLGYLYPGRDNHWVVNNKGTFYRNYNNDVMSLDEDTGIIALSRDGMLQLLPDHLFAENNSLKGKNKEEHRQAMLWRMTLLKEAFAPVDTFLFRNSLRVEHEIDALLKNKLRYVLKEYFDFDLEAEKDPLVRKAAILLPMISKLRGDFPYIRRLMSILTCCEVEMDCSHRFSEYDTTEAWLPMVRYNILIPGLDAQGFKQCTEALSPLVSFVTHWFIPFDVKCEIVVKHHLSKHPENNGMILNYNTEL